MRWKTSQSTLIVEEKDGEERWRREGGGGGIYILGDMVLESGRGRGSLRHQVLTHGSGPCLSTTVRHYDLTDGNSRMLYYLSSSKSYRMLLVIFS